MFFSCICLKETYMEILPEGEELLDPKMRYRSQVLRTTTNCSLDFFLAL